MKIEPVRLETERLTLRSWRPSDRDAFAAMNAEEEVMADQGGPLSRVDSDRKHEGYSQAFEQLGLTRWVVETEIDGFLGYVGIMPADKDHPIGPHFEIGWRLTRRAWGHGYASEAARAALDDGFSRIGLTEVLAYTAADNLRSQAVMARLGLERDPSLDFEKHYDELGMWGALVWVASHNA